MRLYRYILTVISVTILVGCAQTQNTTEQPVAFFEHCFPARFLRAVTTVTTPAQFLSEHPEAQAAINGVYWGADDGASQGIVFIGGEHLASKKGLVSGYMVIREDGKVSVGEALARHVRDGIEGRLVARDIVIGTHPLLVVAGAVHEQAIADRYNIEEYGELKTASRAALGTKNTTEICFAVSPGARTMQEWAELLVDQGYQGAINLDGGSVAQLALRTGDVVHTYGSGLSASRLIFYSLGE